MKIRLVNTAAGLMPMYDEDWEERRKLKPGEVYVAEIKPARNIRFHRLYFALIEAAWSLLPERAAAGFRTREGFRKYLEVAAGVVRTVLLADSRRMAGGAEVDLVLVDGRDALPPALREGQGCHHPHP